MFEQVEDTTRTDKLAKEKELIGCYVSGHPLDDYRKAAEHATLNSRNIAREARTQLAEKEAREAAGANSWRDRGAAKSYTALGMITELRQIATKKGEPMAFANLQDFHGTIALTFFPKTWEKVRDHVHADEVLAITGKIDVSRGIEQPTVIVDGLEDIDTLQSRAMQELHIQLESGISDERQLFDLKELLFGKSGNCAVYLHIDSADKSYTVKANTQLSAPGDPAFVTTVASLPFVRDTWLS